MSEEEEKKKQEEEAKKKEAEELEAKKKAEEAEKAKNADLVDPSKKDKSPVEEAKEVVKAMEEQNKIFKENIEAAKEVAATNLLGGITPAGKEQTKDDIDTLEAKKLLAGTGMESVVDNVDNGTGAVKAPTKENQNV